MMAAVAELVDARSLRALTARLEELRATDRIMRQPGGLPTGPPPPPLHRMGRSPADGEAGP